MSDKSARTCWSMTPMARVTARESRGACDSAERAIIWWMLRVHVYSVADGGAGTAEGAREGTFAED
eukprot:19277-Eustigmatos_ZCMA.PRE.1